MKVVLVTNIPAPYRIPVWNALTDAGIDLTVLFMSLSEPGRQWRVPGGMRFNWKVVGGLTVPVGRRHLRVPLGLMRELIRLRPDAILAGGFGPAAALAMVYRTLAHSRTRVALFGEATVFSERHLPAWKIRWRQWLVARADAFLPASSDARDYFIGLGASPSRIGVSLLTTDLENFARPKVWSSIDRPASTGTILYCGKVSKEKGIGELLEAFSLVRSEFPGATLLMVGNEDQSDHLRALVEQMAGVVWVGFRQPEDLPPYYWDADVFVFPTRCDRFGVVVVEALAAGLPVVCSRYAGCARDLVRDGENGFVVDPSDTSMMAQRILEILKQPRSAERMSQRSLEIVQRYRPAAVIAPILATLASEHCEGNIGAEVSNA